MMEQEVTRPTEDELMEQEEKCRKNLKTLARALFMRLFVMAILVWAVICCKGQALALCLMGLTLVITLMGMLPLVQEWKRQRLTLKRILSQYE